GTEDLLLFEGRPADEHVEYSLDVAHVAGLRLVSGVLEFMDAHGAPRLRMSPPYAVDANGVRSDATVTVDDCAVDRDPSPPWNRAVVAPGRASCTVRLDFSDAGRPIAYPLLLDPTWTSTSNMMTMARRAHTATLLADGTVLVAGGEHPTGTNTTYLKSVDLFDPTTNTFAATGAMTVVRSHHAAVSLSDGTVLVAGGLNTTGALASSEVFDPKAGTWKALGPLKAARADTQAVLLSSGQVLVAGGMDPAQQNPILNSAEHFDPTLGTWTLTTTMQFRRTGHFLTTLPTGQAVAIGGLEVTATADTSSSESYDAAKNAWTLGPSMTNSRHYLAGATFPDGDILVAGGFDEANVKTLASAELLAKGASAWASAGTLATATAHHTLTALSADAAVATGGVTLQNDTTVTTYLKSAELYVAATKSWVALPDLKTARAYHTATALNDGRLLLTGGDGPTGTATSAEFLALDALGAACTADATCASGHCADGVCCSTDCTTSCNACTKAATGKADGTCALVLAGSDPRNDCTDDGSPSCGNDGFCDGAGKCEKYVAAPCTPSACAADADCASGACADGICCDGACTDTCEACTAAKKGSGTDGTCGPVAKGTDPDAECPKEGTGVCAGDALCDGAGACQVPAFGKACATATCADAVTLAAAATCDASGKCTPATTSCIPYRCSTAACTTTCKADTDCAPNAHCASGACSLQGNGSACKTPAQCTSGFCTDGFCCDGACSGQCEACDIKGVEGTCTAATDPPHGARAPCNGTGTCAGTCGGADRTRCSYPTEHVSCGPPECDNGSNVTQGCDGIGSCSLIVGKSCSPYVCARASSDAGDAGGAASCATTCASDADCAAGFSCNADGVCFPTGGTQCKSDRVVEHADGGTTSCGAYLCTNGACGTSCTTSADCAKSATCSHAACVLPKNGGSGGCGCRLASSGGSGNGSDAGAAMAGLFAMLGLALRRVRRQDYGAPESSQGPRRHRS
ncbi:MAG TPA: kelch repeat-containing protein, partial [Polyangiaceae bacterium]|nr:kelch repeat-containing protein [Polyangiaceae bacterium]